MGSALGIAVFGTLQFSILSSNLAANLARISDIPEAERTGAAARQEMVALEH